MSGRGGTTFVTASVSVTAAFVGIGLIGIRLNLAPSEPLGTWREELLMSGTS